MSSKSQLPKPQRQHRHDVRGIIADTLLSDRTAVTPYQPGHHTPALWQDGTDVYAVSSKQPPGFVAYSDQTFAKAAGSVLWVRQPQETGDE